MIKLLLITLSLFILSCEPKDNLLRENQLTLTKILSETQFIINDRYIMELEGKVFDSDDKGNISNLTAIPHPDGWNNKVLIDFKLRNIGFVPCKIIGLETNRKETKKRNKR